MTMTMMMIQEATMMAPTKQTKKPKKTRKQTTTNLREISTPASKTWMNVPNHYPVRWEVLTLRRRRRRRRKKKKKHLNETTPLGPLNPLSMLEAGPTLNKWKSLDLGVSGKSGPTQLQFHLLDSAADDSASPGHSSV